jgi:hypothetical protein
MGSSLYVGFLLGAGHYGLAFAAPAAVGLLSVVWMLVLLGKNGLAKNDSAPQ